MWGESLIPADGNGAFAGYDLRCHDAAAITIAVTQMIMPNTRVVITIHVNRSSERRVDVASMWDVRREGGRKRECMVRSFVNSSRRSKPAHHHESLACHLPRFLARKSHGRRRDDIPEAKNLAECE